MAEATVFQQLAKAMNPWLDLRALAVFRFAIGMACLVEGVMEMAYFQSAFLDEFGVCPATGLANGAMFDLYLASTTSEGNTLLLLLQLVAVLCFMLGYWTKTASFMCWLFAVSQHHRLTHCAAYHGDRLRCHLMFWALFQPLGQAWSVDAYLQRGKPEVFGSDSQALASCLPWLPKEEKVAKEEKDEKDKSLRCMAAPLSAFLILLQMAAMYTYTVTTRVGPLWASGDAVFHTLQLRQYARQPFAGIMAMFPASCRLLTHATLYVETYGWLLAFLPFQLSRTIAFCMFFGLHFGLQICLTVGGFQLVSMSAWCVVLPPFFLDYVESTVNHRWCRSQLLVVQPTAPIQTVKQAIGRAFSIGLTILGFSLLYMAFAEGCIHRHAKCSLQHVVSDFGSRGLLAKLDLQHRFPMFSPDPPGKNLRVQAFGILSSPECLAGGEDYWKHCKVVDLWGDSGYPAVPKQVAFLSLPTWSNLSAPEPHSVEFAINRWKRLVMRRHNAKAIGGYMCAQWKALRQTPDLLGVWYVKITARPGKNETYKGEYRHWCNDKHQQLMLQLPRQPWACGDNITCES